jgi:prepilin-type N-terminal cleavage/methylation domain-containing protein
MILRRFASGRKVIAGFTLIEILVAMVVFSIASLGLAMGVTSVMRANQRSYMASIAINLAQDKLEELKAMSPVNVLACATNCDSPVPTTDGVEFTRTWVVSDDSPVTGVKQIDVTVQWHDHTTHSFTVSSAVKE